MRIGRGIVHAHAKQEKRKGNTPHGGVSMTNYTRDLRLSVALVELSATTTAAGFSLDVATTAASISALFKGEPLLVS